jgi:hypothetical protein
MKDIVARVGLIKEMAVRLGSEVRGSQDKAADENDSRTREE